jgi:hypothetical protein
MNYYGEYEQWYCEACRKYIHPEMGRRSMPPPPPPGKKGNDIKVTIAVLMLAVMLIVSAITYAASVNRQPGSIIDSGTGSSGSVFDPSDDRLEEVRGFPVIEVTLHNNGPDDKLIIKLVHGDPIDWTKYKIILTNNSDGSSTVITQLSSLGWQSTGETFQVNKTIAGFNGLNYEKALSYQLDIYDLRENKRVFTKERLICQ